MKITKRQLKRIINEVLQEPSTPDEDFKAVLAAVGELPPNHPVAAGNATAKDMSNFIIMTVGDDLATPDLVKRVKRAFRGAGLGKNL